jgi:hypothetical protein
MSIKKYPIGLQDFKGLISNGYLYVDKTMHIYHLLTREKYYFLSRPRRFGKSLLVSTLECVAKGEKELFKGLYIYDKWQFDEYPVIKISFSNIGYRDLGLKEAISTTLDSNASKYGLVLKQKGISLKFDELIKILSEHFNKKVVLLIDEYDKPIIDYLDKENIHIAQENRGILKTFYSVLKDADPYLQLVFITGVSKFSQVSIFSDLNNLNDLSFRKDYNEICGISQNELNSYFADELKVYDKEQIRIWYNGYRWHIDGVKLYNPFSLLNFFSSGDFRNYWYATGTPTFLMVMSRELGLYMLDDAQLSSAAIDSFNIDKLQVLPVLFQTGYLTISHYDDILHIYHLDFPNLEVKSSYTEGLLEVYSYMPEPLVPQIMSKLLKSLKDKNPTYLKESINTVFTHIPYPLWQEKKEHFYHAIIHLLFSLLGVYIQSEVHTKSGRADALINIDEGVFCLEFKLDKSAKEAIQQVRNKGYLEAYRHLRKPSYIIGINFSSSLKAVEELIIEEG